MRSIIKLVFLTLLILSLFNFSYLLGKDIANDKQDTSKSIESQSLLTLHYSISSSDLISERKFFNPETFLITVNDDNVSRKSPWLAFGLSYLCPGLGQVYNGEYFKALIFSGTAFTGAALAIVSIMGTSEPFDESPASFWVGVGIASGAYIWSLIDAPISASNINERSRRMSIKVFSTDEDKFAIGLRSGNKIDNYLLDLLLKF